MFDFIVHHLGQINQIAQLLIALLTLHQWIRKLRREKICCTQEEFAELFGVYPRTVQRWEHGERTPRREHLLAMQRMDKHMQIKNIQMRSDFIRHVYKYNLGIKSDISLAEQYTKGKMPPELEEKFESFMKYGEFSW